MIIVGISGKRRSGKTTVANVLENKFGFRHYSLAQPLKAELREEYGLTVDHTDGDRKEVHSPVLGMTPRALMCAYGQRKRLEDPMHWIKKLEAEIFKAESAYLQCAVISDIRFKNEADWVKARGGYMVRLNRSEDLTGKNLSDPSETALDDYKSFDLVIPETENVTLDDAAMVARKIVAQLVNNDSVAL